MSDNHGGALNRDPLFDDFAAGITLTAYGVALRHGTAGRWVDLELDLWKALADTAKTWGREWLRAAGQPEAAHVEGRDGLGPRREARRHPSGE